MAHLETDGSGDELSAVSKTGSGFYREDVSYTSDQKSYPTGNVIDPFVA